MAKFVKQKYAISFSEQKLLFEQIRQWIANTPPLIKPNAGTLASNPFGSKYQVIPLDYSGNSRLGFWYQHLCLEHFLSHPNYQLIAEEVQLNDNGRTLGAIDFVVSHTANQVSDIQIEHWEVAIKFYLLFDGLWFGPNSKDRLDLKLAHMLQHQLSMSQHPCFKQQYPDLINIKPKLLMQGRLYTNPFIPQIIPKKCLGLTLDSSQVNGFWCFWDQVKYIKEPLYILKKSQWLTGKNKHCTRLIEQQDNFIHCQSDSGQFWFILPNAWPYYN